MNEKTIILDARTAKNCLIKVIVKRLEENAEDDVQVPEDYWHDPYIQDRLNAAAPVVQAAQITLKALIDDSHDQFEIEDCISTVAAWIVHKGLEDVRELREHNAKAQAEIEHLKRLLQEPSNQGAVTDNRMEIGNDKVGEASVTEGKRRQTREGEPFYGVKYNGADDEMLAGEAAGTLLKQWLRRDDDVQQFRREVLQDRLFTDDDQGKEAAWSFITSPLPQVLTVKDYEALGLCPATTQGRLLPDPERPFYSSDSSGLYSQKAYRKRDKTGRTMVGFAIEVDFSDGSSHRFHVEHSQESYSYIGLEDGDSGMPLTPNVKGRMGQYMGASAVPCFSQYPTKAERYVECYGTSVVSQAMKVVSNLLPSYPIDVWQLLTFLLTDSVPNTVPIRKLGSSYDYHLTYEDGSFIGGFLAEGGVTLHVQPWVQPESLARYWRETRGIRKHLPKGNALEMFKFALDNTEPHKDFSWQALADQWEREKGQRLPRDTFRKAILGTREALFPKFRFPTPNEI